MRNIIRAAFFLNLAAVIIYWVMLLNKDHGLKIVIQRMAMDLSNPGAYRNWQMAYWLISPIFTMPLWVMAEWLLQTKPKSDHPAKV